MCWLPEGRRDRNSRVPDDRGKGYLIASDERDLPVNDQNEQALLEKLKALPPERVAEVEDFVDFLRTRGDAQQITRAAARAAEPAFRKIGIIQTMPPTTSYSFGDVLLVPFPFTDPGRHQEAPRSHHQ